MDRALKERIIGAAVLVLFVVLVVPVFLDGPPSDTEMVTEQVLLPGQEDQDTRTIVLDRDRTEPVPNNTAEESPQPAARQETPAPAPVRQEAVAEPPSRQPDEDARAEDSAEEPAAPPPAEEQTKPVEQPRLASTTGMWAVQLGSFSNKDNAEKLAADLRRQGYAAFLSQLETEKGQLHRVRIGPQKDRQSAEQMAARLLKVGHKGQVVPHP